MTKYVAPSALILACALLLGLVSCQPELLQSPIATRASPLQTPPSPTVEVEPTAASDTWPTLTPPPTPLPPPPRTPVIKPSPTAKPLPTRPPLHLTPVPKGQIPKDVQAILYTAEDSSLDMGMRQALIDSSGQRWGSERLYGERGLAVAAGQRPGLLRVSVGGMRISPKFGHLAVNIYPSGYAIVDLKTGVIESPGGSYFWSWTPDGRGYVYFAEHDADGKYDIRGHAFVGALGISVRRELDLPRDATGQLIVGNVSFLPDGKTLIYESQNAIWTWNTIDGTRKSVMQETVWIGSMSVSPDGKCVAYVPLDPSNPDRGGDLVVINIETGHTWHWASGAVQGMGERKVAWSPTSTHVAFLAQGHNRSNDPNLTYDEIHQETNLYVMNATDGTVTPITSFSGRVITTLAFSPDGKRIAFDLMPAIPAATPTPGWAEIWVADLETKNIYPISSDARVQTLLVWLPAALLP